MTNPPANVGNKGIEVLKVQTKENQRHAWRIRHEVFVIGQQVPAEDEFDEFENGSTHFLALYDGFPCGAARWRITGKGVKLERFAVLEAYRGKGVGSGLVTAVLQDIGNASETSGKNIYLHAQTSAIGLYTKFDFQQVGEAFYECSIKHFKMVRQLEPFE